MGTPSRSLVRAQCPIQQQTAFLRQAFGNDTAIVVPDGARVPDDLEKLAVTRALLPKF
jgi:hypothetical protein